ncbi:hypothetical protein ACIRUY_19455 [Streptomyces erythrochromogenes]|uniref:hypothetical protein n=1 Tax=Streptomyces erythrochromogenes TaxID=285574 RepID=UPI00382D7C3F
MLIDFSPTGFSVQEAEAGTEGYLDPFLGTLTDVSVYDAHAEPGNAELVRPKRSVIVGEGRDMNVRW